MWILYEGGVIVARLMTRGRPKEEEEDTADKPAVNPGSST
jgi:Sec-independent protein secretion pathway component TatC